MPWIALRLGVLRPGFRPRVTWEIPQTLLTKILDLPSRIPKNENRQLREGSMSRRYVGVQAFPSTPSYAGILEMKKLHCLSYSTHPAIQTATPNLPRPLTPHYH